jgi:hypothetical protein
MKLQSAMNIVDYSMVGGMIMDLTFETERML